MGSDIRGNSFLNSSKTSSGLNSRHGPGPELMRASTLDGDDVVNDNGEALGSIKDIMLDVRNGKIGYAVLSFGSFLGMGEKLFAVPWNALKLEAEKKRFVLNVAKGQLKRAPGFNKDKWPNMADQAWASNIHNYYKTKSYCNV